jgi:hypothetical protein
MENSSSLICSIWSINSPLDVFLEGSLHVLLGVFKAAATNVQSSDTLAVTGRLTASSFIRHHFHSGLDLLERRLVESRTAVIIPFNDCIVFVGLLNSADFSGRFSEVAQTHDPISGIQFLVGGEGLGERRLLGTV